MHVQEAQSFDPHHDPHFSDVVNERFGNGTIWNSSSVNKKKLEEEDRRLGKLMGTRHPGMEMKQQNTM